MLRNASRETWTENVYQWNTLKILKGKTMMNSITLYHFDHNKQEYQLEGTKYNEYKQRAAPDQVMNL